MSFDVDTILTLFLLRQRTAPIIKLEMANNMATAVDKIAMIIHIMFVVTLSATCRKEDKIDISEIEYFPSTLKFWKVLCEQVIESFPFFLVSLDQQ